MLASEEMDGAFVLTLSHNSRACVCLAVWQRGVLRFGDVRVIIVRAPFAREARSRGDCCGWCVNRNRQKSTAVLARKNYRHPTLETVRTVFLCVCVCAFLLLVVCRCVGVCLAASLLRDTRALTRHPFNNRESCIVPTNPEKPPQPSISHTQHK